MTQSLNPIPTFAHKHRRSVTGIHVSQSAGYGIENGPE
jgi:hypothetical protein